MMSSLSVMNEQQQTHKANHTTHPFLALHVDAIVFKLSFQTVVQYNVDITRFKFFFRRLVFIGTLASRAFTVLEFR